MKRISEARIRVEGTAIHHSRLLSGEAVAGALRMSCVGDVIRVEVPEADFSVTLEAASRGGTRLAFQSTFREARPAGGTWWASWELELPDAAPVDRVVGETVVAEIAAARSRFGRMIADAGLRTAAGRGGRAAHGSLSAAA
ncbi:hypothetical protein ACFXJ5_36695 [Streptomyces sp. NPDC059373]